MTWFLRIQHTLRTGFPVLAILGVSCGPTPDSANGTESVVATHSTIIEAKVATTEVTQVDDGLTDQQRMDAYYAPDRVIALTLTMNSDQWAEIRGQVPCGSNNMNCFIGDRYTWFEAEELEVAITHTDGSPVATYTYPNIGIKKKSFMGSRSEVKPSFNIDLAKYDEDNESLAESQIGTKRLTWNNALQDNSVLKQCFGYHLFRLAGLPASRCNFSSLEVYHPDTNTSEWVGIYVNVEPIKKKYMKNPANNFQAGDKGTLYEIATHDIDLTGMTYNDYKGYADDYARQDYGLAAEAMDQDPNGIYGIASTINLDQFNRYWAMEAIIQHRDGYARNITNAYIYNDNDLENANELSTNNTAFKFLPSGIDQIFDKTDCWQLFRCARIPRALYAAGQVDGVNTDISEILTTFGESQSNITAYIEQLRVSANATWTGSDVLYGPNDGQVDRFAAYLVEWFNAALAKAEDSIAGGTNQSCWSDCYNGSGRYCPGGYVTPPTTP